MKIIASGQHYEVVINVTIKKKSKIVPNQPPREVIKSCVVKMLMEQGYLLGEIKFPEFK